MTGRTTTETSAEGALTLTGSGTSIATFYFEPQSGAMAGAMSAGEADITVTTASGTLPFHQSAEQQIILVQ
ncbi:MAG TPA: hypothetical protein VFW98_00805 [Gemmatimonadaceae bacterium]|nr:hypothetical protein [Gemmatimonadaceae bacterium]